MESYLYENEQRESAGYPDIIALLFVCITVCASAYVSVTIRTSKERVLKTGEEGTLVRNAILGAILVIFVFISKEHFEAIGTSSVKPVVSFIIGLYVTNLVARETEYIWVRNGKNEENFRSFKFCIWTFGISYCIIIFSVSISEDRSPEKWIILAFSDIFSAISYLIASKIAEWESDAELYFIHKGKTHDSQVLFLSIVAFEISFLTPTSLTRGFATCAVSAVVFFSYLEFFLAILKNHAVSGNTFHTSKELVLHHVKNAKSPKEFITSNKDILADFLRYCRREIETIVVAIDNTNTRVLVSDFVRCHGLCLDHGEKVDVNEDEAKEIAAKIEASFINKSATTIKFPAFVRNLTGDKKYEKIEEWILDLLVKSLGMDYYKSAFFNGPLWEVCLNGKALENWKSRENEIRKLVLFRLVHNETEMWNYIRKKTGSLSVNLCESSSFASIDQQ